MFGLTPFHFISLFGEELLFRYLIESLAGLCNPLSLPPPYGFRFLMETCRVTPCSHIAPKQLVDLLFCLFYHGWFSFFFFGLN